jgi:hypothetical protein
MATSGRHVSKLSSNAPAKKKRTAPSSRASRYNLHLASVAKPTKTARLPLRPDPRILSEAIPLFFIGRNKDGFWVARDADGPRGGIFLRKQSTVRFANRSTPPVGCAIMFLSKRFELDVENEGNPLVAQFTAARRLVLQLAQRTAPWAVAMAKRIRAILRSPNLGGSNRTGRVRDNRRNAKPVTLGP